jgi:hypothetical protein
VIRAGKLQLPALQSLVPEQNRRGSNRSRMKVQWQVNPQAWLTQTLERIANGWPSIKIDVLMPWNYAA